MTTLPNKKTYIICALTAIYAVVGYVLGLHTGDVAVKLLADSFIGSSLRAGIAKLK